MAYNALGQSDNSPVAAEHTDRDQGALSASPSPPQVLSEPFNLFIDRGGRSHATSLTKGRLNAVVDSIRSKRAEGGSYDVVENDDYSAPSPISPIAISTTDGQGKGGKKAFAPLSIPRPLPRIPKGPTSDASSTSHKDTSPIEALVRTASGHSVALRHPTPDLQALQGAYTGNIEHLEKTAERLSMTSSIEIAIRDLHMEQKRSDSRRSSLLSGQDIPSVSRQVSNAGSIVEVNNAARSGGFSPAGYMRSPVGSVSRSRRSTSKSSRFGSRPEPELEGRPLDSFVNGSSMLSPSIAEQDEDATITKPLVIDMPEAPSGEGTEGERPTTSTSTNTFDQAQKMFADFDGVHTSNERPEEEHNYTLEEHHTSLWGGDLDFPGFENFEITPLQRALSQKGPSRRSRPITGTTQPQPRPKSYADPETGQEMVYYPAPVPMMLNLPQKLSKQTSSMARNKRRSQVLSGIPASARLSGFWLPDVLESANRDEVPADDEAQQLEYIPQHQRMSTGERCLTQDLEHMPPQLRASAYFELPPHEEVVEMKNQSAVATLDSILDASAHAPVSAFTDHAIAGHLGSEVYGRERPQNRRNSTQLLSVETSNKRLSTFSMLKGRRASSIDPLQATEERRRSTMSGFLDFRKSRTQLDYNEVDADAAANTTPLHHSEVDMALEVSDEEHEGQRDDEVYQGAPTTLLAELQIRKQQQKARTRPLTTIYPNGVHSTLLEMDAVAQVSQKSRKGKRVNLAWEEPNPADEEEDDEDVPLGLLFANKMRKQQQDQPLGLMERREMEDNEPLSKRRDRLQGRQPENRASTMIPLRTPSPDEDNETLGQRMRRLKAEKEAANPLPHTRNVSGEFSLEMSSVFGVEAPKPKKSPSPASDEEEETLAQRRTRLKAEKEASSRNVSQQQRPALQTRRSAGDILQAHPMDGDIKIGEGNRMPSTGLLGAHERQKVQRSSTMQELSDQARRVSSGGFANENQRTAQQQQQRYGIRNSMAMNPGMYPQFAQPTMAWQNGNRMSGMFNPNMAFGQNMGMQMQNPMGYGMMGGGMGMQGMNMNMMGMGMGMGMPMQPLNQGQLDMVERWRQSVMN